MTTAIYPRPPIGEPLVQRILRFPLTRLLLSLVFLMLPFLLLQAGVKHLFEDKLFTRMGQLAGACVGCAIYALYVLKVEKRSAAELSLRGFVPEIGAGFALGGLMVCATVAGLAAMGGYHIRSVSAWTVIAMPLLMHLTIGLIEEMLMRGVLFRLVQESLGSWIALAASGVVFGAMHLVNDHVSALAIANIAAFGVMLGAAFVLTGRLWLCFAIHAGWNFAQEGVFSSAVSGQVGTPGWLVGEMNGPEWMTGGAFGLEGSAIALVVLLGVTGVMLLLTRRSGRIVLPFWIRTQRL